MTVRAKHCMAQAVVYPGDENGYVAECINLAVVTQGQTVEETLQNLQEAILLHLEDENLELQTNIKPDMDDLERRTIEHLRAWTKARGLDYDSLSEEEFMALVQQGVAEARKRA